MADADAAAARQLRDRAACLSRTLRIQRSRPTHGFHPAKRPGLSCGITQHYLSHMEIPYTVQPRQDTGLYNAKVGIWLFLASEVMLFGALFSSYILLRVGAPEGFLAARLAERPDRHRNTLVLITSSITTVMAWASLKMNQFSRFKFYHAITILCALTFVVHQIVRVSRQFSITKSR